MKPLMIRIGNFFFRYRNHAFPIIILGLYMMAVPPATVFEEERYEVIKDVAALLLAIAGLAFRGVVIGYAYIKRGGLNKKVYAENLVTEGLFGICRNPLYVGNLLIYAGVFLMHGNPLVMLIGMASFLFIYQCIVYAEEAYLHEKFGEGYLAYCRDVPRWIPKLSQFKAATQGMQFNFKRVILKDYTTIANTLIILALTEEYEELALPTAHQYAYLVFLTGVILFIAVGVAIIKTLKKRRILTEY